MKSRRPLALALALSALAAPAWLHAQRLEDYDYEDLAFRGVGIDFGYLWPNKVEPTPAYSLRFDLGYLGPGVRVAPSLTYWRSTVRGSELERFARQLSGLPGVGAIAAEDLGPIDWGAVSLNLDGHFVWTTPIDLLTYVGLGIGIHALNGDGPAIEGTFVENLLDSVTAGIQAMAGLELARFDRFRLYTEGRYTLLSDIRYAGVRLGGAVMLPSGPAALERR